MDRNCLKLNEFCRENQTCLSTKSLGSFFYHCVNQRSLRRKIHVLKKSYKIDFFFTKINLQLLQNYRLRFLINVSFAFLRF